MKSDKRVIGPETVRMLELGHPWVLADAWTKQWPTGTVGQVIKLIDNKGGFVATALLDPGEPIAARVLSRSAINVNQEWLHRRLEIAIGLRRYCDLEQTNVYRLVNGEGDGLPGLTIDRYGDYLVVQCYSMIWGPYLTLLQNNLRQLVSCTGIYVKERPRTTRNLENIRPNKQLGYLAWGSAAGARYTVQEQGLKYVVSLEQGLDTGLFPDQRATRRELMKRAPGKRVLNLFAYTGSFSVVAAVSGAVQVTSVDVSSTYSSWAQDNFRQNDLDPSRYRFMVGDCFTVLPALQDKGERFDIVLLDPPSFSTTAKNRFTTKRGTSELVALALGLLVEGGVLMASSNHQKIDVTDYLKELRRGALQAHCDLKVISFAGQPEDFPYPVTFPEGRYLKTVSAVKAVLP